VFLPNVYLKINFVLTGQPQIYVEYLEELYLFQTIYFYHIYFICPNVNVDYLQQLSIFQIIYFVLYIFILHVDIAVVNKQMEKQPHVFQISRECPLTSATNVTSHIMKHLDWLC